MSAAEELENLQEKMNWHWRNSMRVVRFFAFDARAAFIGIFLLFRLTSWRLWLLLAINVPFLIGMAGMMIGRHDWMMPALWQFALASIVQLWLAIPFYKSAWASVKGGLANMDVLVTIGTVACE